MSQPRILAIDLNPLHWLGDAASEAIGDVWKSAMTGLWSAALWLLKLAFRIIDAFTTPDLSANGPIGAVLPTTMWIGGALAGSMMFVQLGLAVLRRDGKSMGHVLTGVLQFGLVWIGFLGLAAGFVTAAAGLEHGILRGMLDVSDLSHVDLSGSFPSKVGDITLATVLGILGLLIVIPAAFFYVLIMFVREAALIILVATAPIAAGGLVSEIGRTWFWKSVRWFFSCLLISPMAALVLGIGVKLSAGVINPPAMPSKFHRLKDVTAYANSVNTAHAGMAVVGCIVIAIGACCPMVLFRLLSFVEPGTASGAALRQSWSDAGGISGVLSSPAGSGGGHGAAALVSGGDGRSGGEAGAEAQTASRLASAMGSVGAGARSAAGLAHRAADIGSDILGQAGVGSPGYALTPTDERSSRRAATPRPPGGAASGATHGGGQSGSGPAGDHASATDLSLAEMAGPPAAAGPAGSTNHAPTPPDHRPPTNGTPPATGGA